MIASVEGLERRKGISLVTCSSTSNDCCWTIRSWQLIGKKLPQKTKISPSDNSCCTAPLTGVTCDATNSSVITINWSDMELTGSIPAEIGKLNSLQGLFLGKNQLSGPIPEEIGNLKNLQYLVIRRGNEDLNGTFTPTNCNINLVRGLSNKVILCGCASSFARPTIFPPSGTPSSCLATGLATPLQRRTQVFILTEGDYRFTCTVDDISKNPRQDCLNTISKFCDPEVIKQDPSRYAGYCKNYVAEMTNGMNQYWQAWLKHCAKWSYSPRTLPTGVTTCDIAVKLLKENARYVMDDGTAINVEDDVIDSANQFLWDNVYLKENGF